MKVLVVEDDFTSRKILQNVLSRYGECDVAVNGKEAVTAFKAAHLEGKPYDLICLDIMMPEMDGFEALSKIREVEAGFGLHGLSGVKVVMTTALGDYDSIMKSFRAQCEAYLIKPIDHAKLIKQIKDMGLIE